VKPSETKVKPEVGDRLDLASLPETHTEAIDSMITFFEDSLLLTWTAARGPAGLWAG
jgi:hypothetical protein